MGVEGIIPYIATAILIIIGWLVVQFYRSRPRQISRTWCWPIVEPMQDNSEAVVQAPSVGMDEITTHPLSGYYQQLINDMVGVEDVCDYLFTARVITKSMMEDILAEPTPTKKARVLVARVFMREVNAYDKYYTALTDTGNHHLAELFQHLVSADVLDNFQRGARDKSVMENPPQSVQSLYDSPSIPSSKCVSDSGIEVNLSEVNLASRANRNNVTDSAISEILNTGPSAIWMTRANTYLEKRNPRLCIGSGKEGSDSFLFAYPQDVAASPAGGRFYVTDSNNHRVKIYDEDDGTLITTFGSFGQGNRQFIYPARLAVNSHDEVIIPDFVNGRTVVYSRDGAFKHAFYNIGLNKEKLCYPGGVAVDSSDRVYVCDYGNNRVQVFQRDGQFIRQFGLEASAPGELMWPRYLAVSPRNGHIYVADSGNNRINVFSSDGIFSFTFGTSGVANGEMDNPHGIAVDEHGFVIVSDFGNNRIQVFREDGSFLSTFGSKGAGNGQFYHPHGLTITKHGDVIVVDHGNHRIQIF